MIAAATGANHTRTLASSHRNCIDFFRSHRALVAPRATALPRWTGIHTVRTEIIGHHARTLELPLLVKSVSQVRAEGESSRGVFPPNPEGGILDVLAPCPIISVLTVVTNTLARAEAIHSGSGSSSLTFLFPRTVTLDVSVSSAIPMVSS